MITAKEIMIDTLYSVAAGAILIGIIDIIIYEVIT